MGWRSFTLFCLDNSLSGIRIIKMIRAIAQEHFINKYKKLQKKEHPGKTKNYQVKFIRDIVFYKNN